MHQLDLHLSQTMRRPVDLTGWFVARRTLPRGVMLFGLALSSWAAVWLIAELVSVARGAG